MAILGSLGDLVLSLSADTARFQSDLGRANRVAEKFGREVGGALGKAAAGLIALSGSVGFGALVKGQIDAADAAGELSQQLGVSVEKLSEYQVAAELNNVSQQQLGVGLRQLAKNQADFVAGTGEAKAAFDALGITTEQVNALNGDTAKLFDLVAGKLAQYEDGMNKSALAQKIFGESGATLIPMFNELERGKRIARELGLVYTKDVAEASDRFNDNMSMVGMSVRAVGLNIAKAVLPTLETLSKRLVEAAKDTEGMEKAGRIADSGLKILASAGTIVATIFKSVGETLGGFAAMVVQLLSGRFSEALTTSKNIFTDWQDNVSDAVRSLEDTWTATANRVAAGAAQTGKKLAAPGLVAVSTVKNAQAEIAKMSEELVTSLERQAAGAKMVKDAQAEVNKSFVETAEIATEAGEGMIYTWDEFGNRVEMTREAFDELQKQSKDATKFANDLGLTFSSAFEDAVIAGEKLREVLQGLAKDIARIILRKAVTEPLATGIGDIVKGMFHGGKAGALTDRGPQLAANLTEDMAALGIPFFAEGTPFVKRDGLAFLHRGEAVVSADENRMGAGGLTIHQTFNVASGVSRAEMQAAVEAGNRRTIKVMDELRKR